MEMVDLARRLGAEEEQTHYLWEDYGNDLNSISDSEDDEDKDEWVENVGEEGYYLDGVYYVYPKAV
jgi:hypothetical protein